MSSELKSRMRELKALNEHLNNLLDLAKDKPVALKVHYNKEKKYYEADENNLDALFLVDYMRRNNYTEFSSARLTLAKVEGCIFITYILMIPYLAGKCYGCGYMDREGNQIPGSTTVCDNCYKPSVVYDKKAGIDHTDTISTAIHWKPDCPDPENCNKCGVCVGCGSEKRVNVQTPDGKWMCEECWT